MIHTLEADGILLEFGIRKILSDIYIKCETKKITGLLGRNGEGKTCLLNIIYGSLKSENKSIRIDQQFILYPFRHPELLVYLPQFSFLPPSLSLKRIFKDFEIDYSMFEKEFPEVSLRYNCKIRQLSGGERRLIEVFLILKSQAQFAMLDEPFSHIMPLHIEKIKQIMMEEKERKGILITDHMYRHITDISDNLYVLANGKANLAKNREDIERFGYVRFNRL
jgi:ABC-type lipopolysaccharide export system ATPase subunit